MRPCLLPSSCIVVASLACSGPAPEGKDLDNPGAPALSFVDASDLALHYGEAETLVVVVEAAAGGPLSGVEVSFALDPSDAPASLSVARAVSDENGEARVTLIAGNRDGEFEIVASAEDAARIKRKVAVTAAEPNARVHVEYAGDASIDHVDVLLFDSDDACADFDPGDDPSIVIEPLARVTIDNEPVVGFSDRDLVLAPDVALHWAVGLAYDADDVQVAWGCVDELAPPATDPPTAIDIALADL